MQSFLNDFKFYLESDEKSDITIQKYLRDVRCFLGYIQGQPITKELCISYKSRLVDMGRYTVGSINTILASINSFLKFIGKSDCTVKFLKLQKKIYCAEDKELTKSEYFRLVEAAKSNLRLSLIIETICATGIRVSELQYFTVESVRAGEVCVCCKNKTRNIFVPGKLRKKILTYIKRNKIQSGVVFRTRSGRPIDRTNIWADMKKLSKRAGVCQAKVFPHNLRKLFARTFYGIERDIAKLADILGHSSINTTRIYIMSTGAEHRKLIERMYLVT